MTCRHAEVDQRLPFSLGVPRRDRIRAQLELERGGHAVVCHVAVVDRILAVRVEIDEARRDDESPDVDGVARRGYTRGHRDDASTSDSHGAHRVEVRLRVEHSTADEHDVDGSARFPCDLGIGRFPHDSREESGHGKREADSRRARDLHHSHWS